MAVTPYPGYGNGGYGGTMGEASTDNTQYDYTDDEVGAYPFGNGNGNGLGAETKEEMSARWETKHKAVFIGVVILTLLAVK